MRMTFPCYSKEEAKKRNKAAKLRGKAAERMRKIDPQRAFNTFIAPPAPVAAPKRRWGFFSR